MLTMDMEVVNDLAHFAFEMLDYECRRVLMRCSKRSACFARVFNTARMVKSRIEVVDG